MRLAPRTLGITAVLALIVALLSLGSAAAEDTPADPLAGAPAVRACYDLTYKQAYAHDTNEATVPCGHRHTMVVTAVGKAPASIDWATLDWDKQLPAALVNAINRTCDPATTKLLGTPRKRALTLYDQYWFAPSKEDVAAGAHWFSCLVALTESTRLLPIPSGQPKKIGRKIPKRIAHCARTARTSYPTVACSRPHRWRAVYAKPIRGRLTDKRALAAAKRTCPRHVSSEEWLYFTTWVSTKKFIIGCSTKTRH
ncbi:septum formation family protein [Nocardioides sp. URHA0020]|uniref:septum formation family protein n=1 Tax=Nocardioides sp. URHA0020 TaxID=1380392 RepID=UPI00048AB083|nr:septum formation family protein [Nocardioides sp. URHA0020]